MAKRLMVAGIPHQSLVSPMWPDVINVRRHRHALLTHTPTVLGISTFEAIAAQRMLLQPAGPVSLPSVGVTPRTR